VNSSRFSSRFQQYVLKHLFVGTELHYAILSYSVIDLVIILCVYTFATCINLYLSVFLQFFKPPPPVGAGGGYVFSGRPSVPLSVRAYVRLCIRP